MSVTLAGMTLPDPERMGKERKIIGEFHDMCDGSLDFYIGSVRGFRWKWNLGWDFLTAAQDATLAAALTAALISNVSWVPLAGESYTVRMTSPEKHDYMTNAPTLFTVNCVLEEVD